MLAGDEAVTDFTVVQNAIAIPVKLVEDNKYLVLGDLQVKVIHECHVEVITVDTLLREVQLDEHLEGVAHVEIRSKCKISPLLLELPFELGHVAHSLGEVSLLWEHFDE